MRVLIFLILAYTLCLSSPLTSSSPPSYSSPTSPTACPAWSYDDTLSNGPSHWGDLCTDYTSCKTGLSQSPVDLSPPVLGIEDQLSNLECNYKVLNNFTLINTRQTVEGTNLGVGNTLSFIGLHEYTLTEFHFHSPSEHRINGEQFPLEMHYLHSDGQGNFATLAILYNSSGTPGENSWLLQFMALLLPDVPTDNSSTIVPSLDISSQINISGGYYHYVGSTTTPPCSPGVQWFVLSQVISVDAGLLSKFTSFLRNSRPPQPLNGRVPAIYTAGTQPDNIDKWVFGMGIAGLGALAVLVLLGITRYLYRLYHAKRYENQQELAGFLGSTNNETL